jgi:hypothetical protein
MSWPFLFSTTSLEGTADVDATDAVADDNSEDAVADSDNDKDNVDPAEVLLVVASAGAVVSTAGSSGGFTSTGAGSSCLRN